MKNNAIIKRASEFSQPYCITDGKDFRLGDYDPQDTLHLDSHDKPDAKNALKDGVEALSEFQERLYAQDKWAVLLIFQAMDAAGKDSTIKHVMSGINPQGCDVHSFKAPSSNELDHDYMWRCFKVLPNRGHIGIFNRSYYEETLVVRVHPKILQNQKLASRLITDNIWSQRFEDIRNLEQYLSRNGVVIRKFFLNVSKEEQKKRFLARLERPEKNWKFSANDVKERRYWDDYQAAYEDMIRNTSSKEAPWYVVPADNKWFTRVVVAAAIIDTLSGLDLQFPKVNPADFERLMASKKELMEE